MSDNQQNDSQIGAGDNNTSNNNWQERMKNLTDAQRQLFENMQAMTGFNAFKNPQHQQATQNQQADLEPTKQSAYQQSSHQQSTGEQSQSEHSQNTQSQSTQSQNTQSNSDNNQANQNIWESWQQMMQNAPNAGMGANPFTANAAANPFTANAGANPFAGAAQNQWQPGPIPEATFTKEQFQAFAGANHPPGQPPTSTLIKLKESGTLPPFFCVHAMLGSAFPYHQLALNLPQEQPCYGLQSRGLDGVLEPLEKIEEMAELYVSLIKEVQPKGPYYIGGYSFGGWIAFEMARVLRNSGDTVALLAMFETSVPFANPLGINTESVMQYQKDYMNLLLNSFLSEEQRVMTENQMNHDQGKQPIQKVIEANYKAQLAYSPRPADTAIELFITKDVKTLFANDPTMGWKWMCTQQINVSEIEGNHLSMFQPPHVVTLAEKLNEVLNRCRTKAH